MSEGTNKDKMLFLIIQEMLAFFTMTACILIIKKTKKKHNLKAKMQRSLRWKEVSPSLHRLNFIVVSHLNIFFSLIYNSCSSMFARMNLELFTY